LQNFNLASKTNNNFFNSTSLGNNKNIELEQKKLKAILEANEKIQEKLNRLLSQSPVFKEKFLVGSDYDQEKKYSKKKMLPSLRNNVEDRFASTHNDFQFKIRNLKPISKDTYDRLTGFNRTSQFNTNNANNDYITNNLKKN